ncbi:MAG: hypothetical protein K1X94_08905 [Sandaracinaceae bacterium]|nr:hypothetical protein [Sandaracinaceae bacterium]
MTDSVAELTTQMMVAQGSLLVLGLVMQIAFFVVALTVVRRASKPASGLMITASAITFLSSIVHPVISVFTSRLGSVEDTLRTNTLLSIVFGLIGLASSSLLLAGMVRLANDATSRDTRDRHDTER